MSKITIITIAMCSTALFIYGLVFLWIYLDRRRHKKERTKLVEERNKQMRLFMSQQEITELSERTVREIIENILKVTKFTVADKNECIFIFSDKEDKYAKEGRKALYVNIAYGEACVPEQFKDLNVEYYHEMWFSGNSEPTKTGLNIQEEWLATILRERLRLKQVVQEITNRSLGGWGT